MSVRVTLDKSAMNRVIGRHSRESLTRAADATVTRAQANAPRDTGNLANSIIRSSVVQEGFMRYRATVFSDLEYAIYQEEGTRAHGPARANFMVFTPKGSSTKVFTKWVRGVPATRFMRRAREALTPADFAR